MILKALFFTAAAICFIAAAFRSGEYFRNLRLVPTGLALAVIPFAFDAWDAVGD